MTETEIKNAWDRFLEPIRIRESKEEKAENDARTPFENDYSRVIMSSALRRLQDKTQVFPLEKEDFVRTRLTHSLEVAYFGENIGRSLEEKLMSQGKLDLNKKGYIPKILATAGLVHDLGNPPFGHYGEKCIRDFFKEYFKDNNVLSDTRLRKDLELFDGNVQTFRALTKLQFLGEKKGFNLTCPTLATVIKYPYSSWDNKKKIGYYYSEKEMYDKIVEKIMPKLKNRRYPLTYLLEAADDIAYCIADIEDGIQKKLVKLSDIKGKLEKCLLEEENDKLNKKEEFIKSLKLSENEEEKIIVQNLKIFLQGKMISYVVDAFVENQEKIFKGEFEGEILEKTPYYKIREELKEITKEKIFKSKEIIEREILGYKVIRELLKVFVNAEMDIANNGKNANTQSEKIEKLISDNYKYICKNIEENGTDEIKKYNRLKLCVDFISGMTDNYALNLFKKINGLNN